MGWYRQTSLFIAGIVCFSMFLAVPVFGQSSSAEASAASSTDAWSVPRTAWGHPNLEGVWTTDDESHVPVERASDLADRLELTSEEVAASIAGRKALIMRYIERTLSSKEKSQSLSSQSNTVP